jgi:hypothetical protein
LPGEGHRNTPRLERQEAFRAPKTWNVSDTDIVVDDAELYRLGILYDGDQENDYVHSSGFCLDAIVHPDPVYSLRPTKRVKRSHDNRLPPLEYEDLHLSIELLSAYLGDDAAIARFLTPVGDDERARLYHVDFNDPNNNKNALTEGVGTTEPSTVIYELSESSTPSLTPASAMNDFPGLTSNRGKEGDEEYEEDSNFDDGWALVVGSSITANAGTSHAAVRIDVDGNEETAAAANDAWVLIAGDDS